MSDFLEDGWGFLIGLLLVLAIAVIALLVVTFNGVHPTTPPAAQCQSVNCPTF